VSKGSILHVVTSVEVGGIEILVRDLARLQRAAGYQVNVCCIGGWAGALEQDFLGLGVGVHPTRRWRSPGGIPRCAASVAGILRRTRPTIVHVHTEGMAAILPVLIARAHGVRSLVRSIHSCYHHGSSRVRRLWFRLELSLSVALGTRIVAVSEEVRRWESQHLRLPESWITVVENGLDLERFANASGRAVDLAALIGQTGPRQQLFLVLCVAGLRPEKNHAVLLRAMAELRRRGCPRDPHLLLAGAGQLEAELRRLAQELDLERHVHFLGLRRDIPELLAAADVFAMASDREGLPICAAEAMAAGKPVVATNVPGLAAVIVDNHTGLLVPPRNPEALADALERLARDPDLCQRLGSAGRARAMQRYSIRACAAAYERLYQPH